MAATDLHEWSVTWIDSAPPLAERLARWGHGVPVAMDTEFVRERTFWPNLALVQLAIPGDIVLADSTAAGICEVLGSWLTQPASLKIMHAAGEDLQALRVACGVVPAQLFDTQIAAGLAGVGASMSYQKLVEQLTGVTLSKGETRSEWLQRPLSDAQRDYAADDVRHLHALHAQLSVRLAELGRSHWLAQECTRQLDNERNQQPDPWPHLSLRSAQMLAPLAQWRLCRLLHWRERQAVESNRPRTWILDNELAVALARGEQSGRAAFDRLLDSHPRSPRRHRDALWDLLADPGPPPDPMPLANAQSVASREQIRLWQDAVKARSEQLGLPDGVLASRRLLEALLERGIWPEDTSDWRRTVLDPLLVRSATPDTTGG